MKRSGLFVFITAICRVWGTVTFIALWAIAIKYLVESGDPGVGAYLMLFAILITFFELLWLMTKLTCCTEDNWLSRIWHLLLWVDDWRKTVLYFLVSVPCFALSRNDFSLSIIAGSLGDFLGLWYFLRTFRHKKSDEERSGLVQGDAVTQPSTPMTTPVGMPMPSENGKSQEIPLTPAQTPS